LGLIFWLISGRDDKNYLPFEYLVVMLDKNRIYQEYSFESDRIQGLQLLRKVAYIFQFIKIGLEFLLLSLFSSMFLSIFRIFMDIESYFAYGIIAFITLILSLIIYSNLKDTILAKIDRILPQVKLSDSSRKSFAVLLLVFILGLAWAISFATFDSVDFTKNGFNFILRWALHFPVLSGIGIISVIMSIPITKYEVQYSERIVSWVLSKWDSNYKKNERHRWPALSKLFISGEESQKEAHPGIDIFDLERAFPLFIFEFHSASIDDSYSFKNGNFELELAEAEFKTKHVNQRPGKTEIEIKSIFKGTIFGAKVSDESVFTKISTQLNAPTFLGIDANVTIETQNGVKLALIGNLKLKQIQEIKSTVVTIQKLWKSDVTLVLNDGYLYLLLHQTRIFMDLAFSASLFSDEPVKLPTETLDVFLKLCKSLKS